MQQSQIVPWWIWIELALSVGNIHKQSIFVFFFQRPKHVVIYNYDLVYEKCILSPHLRSLVLKLRHDSADTDSRDRSVACIVTQEHSTKSMFAGGSWDREGEKRRG